VHGDVQSFFKYYGPVIFEEEIVGTNEIKFWIMNWGAKALVLEPASLRDEISSEALVIWLSSCRA